ncbi:hypothetical protein CFI00_17020 [Nocardioides sp. S5]|nr:hypothetical protein CFI00_17020 [Nocardioides sp. S5]
MVREAVVDSVEEKRGRTVARATTRLSEPDGALLLIRRQDLCYHEAAPAPTAYTDSSPASAHACRAATDRRW